MFQIQAFARYEPAAVNVHGVARQEPCAVFSNGDALQFGTCANQGGSEAARSTVGIYRQLDRAPPGGYSGHPEQLHNHYDLAPSRFPAEKVGVATLVEERRPAPE